MIDPLQSPEHALAPHLRLVRLQAEAALVRRLNSGYGFTDAGVPAQIYLRDPAARERLGRDALRPEDTHLEQAQELAEAIAELEAEIAVHASPIATLIERFALAENEAALLTAAIAYELDVDARNLFNGLAGSRAPGLYLDTCQDVIPILADTPSTLAAVHPSATLPWNQLITIPDPDSPRPQMAGRIGLGRRLLSWILGDDRLATPLHSLVAILAPGHDPTVHLDEETIARIDEVAGLLRAQRRGVEPITAVLIQGPQGVGKGAVAHRLARTLNRALARAPLPGLLDASTSDRELVREAMTEARLRGALPYLGAIDTMAAQSDPPRDLRGAMDAIDRYPGTIILSTRERGMPSLPVARPFHLIQVPRPSLQVRRQAWKAGLTRLGEATKVGADEAPSLAARYVVGPGTIAEVLDEARAFANATGTPVSRVGIEEAVGRRLTLRLGAFGTLLTRRASFDEMVLPEDIIDTLRDMIAMVNQRAKILEEWGYAKHLSISRGVSALFSGEPGTGKTMAASVISGELGIDLVRIDLSSVVSKWVGETEKHLARIFDEAQHANAMLVFDEADSLFGKRTEIKSAQDRFANLEVNYVLQRMETFDGICILTSNLEASIDPAFLRRLNFRVRFPKPDVDERIELWRKLLPPETGIVDKIDFAALAERFEMTGGHIRNSIMRAAVVAAREGRRMTPRDLLVGAHLEYLEIGKVMPTLLD